MWDSIKTMLASKKAMMAILSAVVYIVGRFGLELNLEDLAMIVTPLWAYIVGQSVADFGKEGRKVLVEGMAARDEDPTEPS